MTPEEIRALIVAADPNAGHYESAYQGGAAYTVWKESRTIPMMADGEHCGAIRFQIDRYTKIEDDPIAAALESALERNDRVAYAHITDYEHDTRYIHHIFDCEGY